MSEQKKVEKVNKLYNNIFQEEFSKDASFSDYISKFSVEKSDVINGFMPVSLKPRLNTKEQLKIAKIITETVLKGLSKIETSLARGNKSLQECMGLSDQEVSLIRLPKKFTFPYPFVRFDTVLAEKKIKLIEINLNFPGGCGVMDQLEANFSKFNSIKKLSSKIKLKKPRKIDEELLKTMLRCYRESGFSEKKPNILILRKNDYDVSFDSDNLAKYFQKNGFPVQIADPRDVKFNGKYVEYKGFISSLLLKWFDFHPYLEDFNLYKELIEAIKKEKAIMLNPFSAAIIAAKTSFAVMTNPAFHYLFSKKEIKIFDECVPWTRLFDKTLINYAKKNKKKVILKPATGTCGKNIFVGISYSDKEWAQEIDRVLKEKRNYIIQERVSIAEEEFPLVKQGNLIFEKKRIDFNPFLFNGKYFDAMSRCAHGYILNGYQGGIIALNYTIL